MEKDKLLKNIPLEMLAKVKKLATRLWEENNPVAVHLSVIVEEFEAETEAMENLLKNYDKYYTEKIDGIHKDRAAETGRFNEEIAAFKERTGDLEEAAKAAAARIKELRSALEKSESEGREKYTKEEVFMLEQQILELKKEVGEFRQLKEMDDRRILELEAMVATKTEEVERRYIGKMTLIEKESAELKTQNAALEKSKLEDDARIKELRSALEKSERESREKYTREEVAMIEQQILDLKKEVSEFRQLKEMDDRRIMELEAMVATKAEEVERRFISKTTLLENESVELKAQVAELEKSKVEDDARIKEFRTAVEKIGRESREKYTKAEVDMLESQILDMKKEVLEFRQLKEMDDRKIAEQEAMLAARTGDVDNKFIGRITMLENKAIELNACSAELEKTNAEKEKRMAEMKRIIAMKDREISERYAESDLKQLEATIAALHAEAAGLRTVKREDEKKIAELERIVGTKTDEAEKKYIGNISALEVQYNELKNELAEIEAANSKNIAKIAEMKKSIIAKDRENMEIKARLSDTEMEFGAKLAGLRDNYFLEQRRKGEMLEKMEEEALLKLAERKKELEREYEARSGQLKVRVGGLATEYEAKQKDLAAHKRALEEDFSASKRDLLQTFDKIRHELERREKELDEREGNPKRPGGAGT